MKQLHWRPLARQDADDAASLYASQGGLALLAFVDELLAATELIACHPGSGSTRHAVLFPDLSTPLRFVPLKRLERYLIYYLEPPDHLDIIRIWDAARDVPARMEAAK